MDFLGRGKLSEEGGDVGAGAVGDGEPLQPKQRATSGEKKNEEKGEEEAKGEMSLVDRSERRESSKEIDGNRAKKDSSKQEKKNIVSL